MSTDGEFERQIRDELDDAAAVVAGRTTIINQAQPTRQPLTFSMTDFLKEVSLVALLAEQAISHHSQIEHLSDDTTNTVAHALQSVREAIDAMVACGVVADTRAGK